MSFRNVLQRKGRLSQQKRDQLLEYANIIGVNYADSIYTMAENQSPYAKNVDFGDPIGCFTKRKGYESLITSLGAGKVLGLNNWQHSVGDKMMMAWDKNLYLMSGNTGSIAKSSKADWDAGTLDNLDTATSSGDMLLVAGVAVTDFLDDPTLTADFNGTHSTTEAINDSVKLSQVSNAGSTRLYIQNAAADYDPATERGAWDTTSGHVVKKLSKVKSGAITSKNIQETSSLGNYDVLVLKTVSDAIAVGKTISGTLSWCLGVMEMSLNNDDYYHIHAFVTQGDTDNVRGTLLSNYIGTSEWGATAKGKTVSAQTLTSVAAQAGDRIVIEIGYRSTNTSGGQNIGTVYYGGTSSTDLVNGGSASTYPGWFEFSADPFDHYETSGAYTHGVLDISTVGWVKTASLTYNKTTPVNTAANFQVCFSYDEGVSWSAWTNFASGGTFINANTDVRLWRVQWRVELSTSDTSVSPSLDDVTVDIKCQSNNAGEWLSEVYDLTNTPTTNTISYSVTTPADTSAKVYARGSSSGTVFGDWQEVLSSGDSIPLQRYIQIKIILTSTDAAATPTFSDFLITYNTGYTVTHKLDISPLGRVDNKLSGNSVCFCNYEDWCLVTDGLRPFLLYITDTTQESDTAQAGGASTITLKAGASAVNSHYNNAFITITGGTGEGQTRWISGYDGATKIATVSVAWTTQPDNTSTYTIGSAIKARNIGVDPPSVAPSGVEDVAGSPNGAYKLMVTYVNADGVESNPSAASALVTVSSKKILWTIPVDTSTGNTTAKRRLYRTAAGGAVYKYLAEVADNTTATYLDNTADTALGSLMLDNNNVPPSTCTLIYTFTSYVFYVTEGYYVRFSKAGAPDQCPYSESDVQEISFPDEVLDIKSSPIALIFGGENFLASVTSNGGFIFDSDPNIDTTIMKVVDIHGGMSYRASAMCISPNLKSALVVNTNVGLRSIIPGLQDNSVESVPFSKNMQKYYDRSINRHQAAAIFHNNYYIYSFEYMAEDASESEYLTFAYDFRTEQWNGPWTFGMSAYTIQGNDLYAGDTANGKVYKMFTGNTDAGSAIVMECDMPMRAPGSEAGTCKFKRLMAIIHGDSTTTSTIIKPKVDEAECTVTLGTLATTFTGDERPGHDFIRTRKYGIGLPRGHTYSLRIVDDSVNPLRVMKIITEYEVLPLRN